MNLDKIRKFCYISQLQKIYGSLKYCKELSGNAEEQAQHDFFFIVYWKALFAG